MPSVINPRSGPFPVYSSTNPPTVDVGIFTVAKTGIDLKNAATTNIFTVPTGRTFILTGTGYLVTAVTSGGAGTITFQIKESSSSRTMSGSFIDSSGTPVANQSVKYYPAEIGTAAGRSNCTAGNSVQFVLGASSAGSSAVTGTGYAIGFYSS